MHCDVVVVGLGPAGAHFSYLASNLGYKVIALEKETIHKSKTCAGGISPLSVKILKECYKRIPSEVIEREVDGVNLETHTHKYSMSLPKIEAFTTRRLKFDSWLADETIKKGTIAKERCKLKRISFSKESVSVEIREHGSVEEIRADCIIGAYGAGSSVPRIMGIPAPKTVTGVQYELELPAEAIERSFGNTLNFYYCSRFSKFGYAWIFPKKDSIAVGLLDSTPTQLAERLKSFVRTNDLISRRFGDFDETNMKMRGALLPNETLNQTYQDRVILIGDAAGFGDRITWEGISYALRSADCAVKTFSFAYERNDFSSSVLKAYQRMWESSFGKDLRYGKKLQKMLFDENLDVTWSKVISFLAENDNLTEVLIDEMRKHMSIARALGRLPKKEKLLLLKHVGYKKALIFLAHEAMNIG